MEDDPLSQDESKDQEKKAKQLKAFVKPTKIGAKHDTKRASIDSKNQPDGNKTSHELKTNLDRIRKDFFLPQNQDVIIREFKVGKKTDAAIVFMEGMADQKIINDFILRPLMTEERFDYARNNAPELDYIVDNVLSVNQISVVNEYQMIIMRILSGQTALFIDGRQECLVIETRGFEKRNIETPVTEMAIRGSHEGFTENLRTNISLIRRIIKNNNLISEIFPIGKTNKADCSLMYLKGVANPNLIKEVKRRVKSLDIDYIGGVGMLENLIEDNPWMPLPQTLSTERPDRAVSFLMEGKVLAIVEGTPFATALPADFFQMIQTSEDLFLRWQYGTFLRLIRILGIIMAALLPGLYISLVSFHHEAIPSDLLTSIIKSHENVPFPTVLEVLLMEVSFELIREAGIRIPGIMGNTLGIVGALILGQAAVSADIVSPILVIIVAITALGNFAIPNYELSFGIRIIRFGFIILGAMAGFYGISAGIVILGGIICDIKSFGAPFLAPIAPKTKTGSESIIQKPLFKLKERPDPSNPLDRRRAGRRVRRWTRKDNRDNQ